MTNEIRIRFDGCRGGYGIHTNKKGYATGLHKLTFRVSEALGVDKRERITFDWRGLNELLTVHEHGNETPIYEANLAHTTRKEAPSGRSNNYKTEELRVGGSGSIKLDALSKTRAPASLRKIKIDFGEAQDGCRSTDLTVENLTSDLAPSWWCVATGDDAECDLII